MSRPLGSRNKSTLERLEFERKVRNLMEKENAKYIDKFKGVSRDYTRPNSGYVLSSVNPVRSNPVRININNDIPKEDVANKMKEDAIKMDKMDNNASNTNNEAPKKRRGRPRKNPSPEISNVENVEATKTEFTKTESVDNSVDNVDNFTETENNSAIETDNNPTETVTETSKRRSKTSGDNTPRCSRCDTIILCSPNRADTNAVSGVSDYHRSSPRYVILCDSCSQELSRLIDEWLWNNGLGVKPKPWSEFGVKEMRQSESESHEENPIG